MPTHASQVQDGCGLRRFGAEFGAQFIEPVEQRRMHASRRYAMPADVGFEGGGQTAHIKIVSEVILVSMRRMVILIRSAERRAPARG